MLGRKTIKVDFNVTQCKMIKLKINIENNKIKHHELAWKTWNPSCETMSISIIFNHLNVEWWNKK